MRLALFAFLISGLLAADIAPARAGDFMVDLEKNLATFTGLYNSYMREPNAKNQDLVSKTESFLTEQVFSVVSDEKLYRAALEAVNRHAKASPAAIADVGMKLQIRWEKDYLASFYLVESKRRALMEIPAETILIVGGIIIGSHNVADPAVTGKYFSTFQKIYMGVAAVPIGGATYLTYKLEKLPVPPAAVIFVAQMDQTDYRAKAAADAESRKYMARTLGMIAQVRALVAGLGAVRVLAGKSTAGASALLLAVLFGSWYLDHTVTDATNLSFAWADESVLEAEMKTAFFAADYARRHSTHAITTGRTNSFEIFASIRDLSDAVMKLQAHRDLDIIAPEMDLEDRLDEIETKFGKGALTKEQQEQKKALLISAAANYRVTLRQVVANRGPQLIHPMTAHRIVRERLRAIELSPFEPKERETLRYLISQWPAPLREAAAPWTGPSNWILMTHEEGIRTFRQFLADEEVKEQDSLVSGLADLNFPRSPYAKQSDGLYLQTAAFIRSLKYPPISYVADLFENRATHFAELLLEARYGGQ